MKNNKYPEHEKLIRVKDEAEILGNFLEWLQTKFYLCDITVDVELNYFNHPSVYRTAKGIEDILYEYYNIDSKEIENEKQLMLNKLNNS